MALSPTPLSEWLAEHQKWTFDRISHKCQRAGMKTSPEYIKQIAYGWQRPGTKLALHLVSILPGLDLAKLIAFPYRRPSKSKAA